MSQATTSVAADGKENADIPLFDARFRWVLRAALGALRARPEVDLDDAEQMSAAYGILSEMVQQAIHERKLLGKLDAATVAAVAGDDALLSTAMKVLLKWLHGAEELEGGSG
jgi:hypothetical protein